MAVYKIPGQNLTFNIPNDGEVWVDPNDTFRSRVYVRTGNTVDSLNIEELGQKAFEKKVRDAGFSIGQIVPYKDRKKLTDAGIPSQFLGSKQAFKIMPNNGQYIGNLGRETLKKDFGIDFDSITAKNYNFGDISSSHLTSSSGGITGDKLKSAIAGPVKKGEVVTQGVSKTNPNAKTVTSNIEGDISPKSPKFGQEGSLDPGVVGFKNKATTDVPTKEKEPIPLLKKQQPVDILEFNKAIVNKDFTTLEKMGVDTSNFDPATGKQVRNLTPEPVKKPAPLLKQQPVQNKTQTNVDVPSDPSIVNFLDRQGKSSDFGTRTEIAKQQGIQGYKGTAEQNTQLLSALRTEQKPTITPEKVEQTKQVVQEATKVATKAAEVAGLPTFKPGAEVTPAGILQPTQAGKDEFAKQVTSPLGSQEGTKQIIQKSTEVATKAAELAKLPKFKPGATVTPEGVQITDEGQKRLEEIKQLETEVNVEQEKELNTILETQKKGDVDVSESSKLLATLSEKSKDVITGADQPEPPTMVEQFKTLMSEAGVEPLKTEMADIDSQIEEIQSNLIIEAEKAGERLVSMGEITRKRGQLQTRAEQRIQKLQIARNSVARRLDNKLNTINTIMDLTQQDFQNATATYDKEFSKNIQLINLLTKEENQDIAEAQANLNTIINLSQESGKTFGEMTPDMQRQIRQLEVEQGLPQGTTEAFLSAKPKTNVLSTTKGTDAQGNDITTFIYEDPKTGKKGTVEIVKTGGVEKETVREPSPTELRKQEEKANVFLNEDYFKTLFTEDQLLDSARESGFDARGFSKDEDIKDYLAYLTDLVEQYRTAGYTDKEILKQMQ